MAQRTQPRQPIRGVLLSLLFFVGLVQGATKPEPTALPGTKNAENSAKVQLQVGAIYERSGHFGEAEAAYSKAIVDGSGETRRIALVALDRVLQLRGNAGPGSQLKLGASYEHEGRLADAETAYAKVLENGTPAMRLEAILRMRNVIERRESFYQKHLLPIWDTFQKASVVVILGLAALLILRSPLRWYGRRRYRNALVISGFGLASGSQAIGSTFCDALTSMHERMVVHFQPRGALGNRAMPVLVQSQSAELVDLVSAVSAPAVPFAKWFAGILLQPANRITGSIESTWWNIKVRAKIEHSGLTVAHWDKTYLLTGWFVAEQDLAYEILLKLKEYIDAHAS